MAPLECGGSQYSRTLVTWTLKGKEKQFELAGSSIYQSKFQWNLGQGRANLVWISGEFELSEFELLRSYCAYYFSALIFQFFSIPSILIFLYFFRSTSKQLTWKNVKDSLKKLKMKRFVLYLIFNFGKMVEKISILVKISLSVICFF